jgi:hypothetical protein
MYLINDIKISIISEYIQKPFTEAIKKLTNEPDRLLFGWELAHKNVKGRVMRKSIQLFVDELTFVGSGLGAILVVLMLVPNIHILLQYAMLFETILLAILGFEIIINSGLKAEA